MKQYGIFIFLMLTVLTYSCTVPKDARQLKRITNEWQKSTPVLEGYGDSPFGGTTITLRENEKFEMNSSGFFLNWYEAGTWAFTQDTIRLSFVDSRLQVTKTQNVYLNRQGSLLYFMNADTIEMRLRIMFNQLIN